MVRRPPRSTPTDTLFPDRALFRAVPHGRPPVRAPRTAARQRAWREKETDRARRQAPAGAVMSVPEREEKAELATEPGAAERAVAPPSPDGFRLEGEMPSVMRLSPRTLAIIGGTAGLAIAGALLWALRPPAPGPRGEVDWKTGVEGKRG